jgi:hypothetical protein
MVAAQLLLAFACVGLGVASTAVMSPLARIAAATTRQPPLLEEIPTLPLPLLLVVLTGTTAALAGWMSLLARSRPVRRFITWECGFGDLSPRTQYTAASFAQPIARMFGAIYHYSLTVSIHGRDRRHFPERVVVDLTHEPYLETRLYAPLLRLVHRASATLLMRLQAGSIHQYLLFMLLALGALLWLGSR